MRFDIVILAVMLTLMVAAICDFMPEDIKPWYHRCLDKWRSGKLDK
ncbi:MAG: hypothetical protein Q7R92_05500 [bacterium]|nr:hypothetical protein [bacterium]